MKYFIGIVPPPDIYNTLLKIQTRFGDNRLEPHITLRAPVAPIDADNWISTTHNICTNFNSFNIDLPTTGRFGKRVLFVDVQSTVLRELYKRLIPAIKSFEPLDGEDNRPYHPHLTLGRSWCGFTKDDFDKMQELTDNFLHQNSVSFEVRSIRIYHKLGHSKRYETLKDIALK